MTIKEFTNYEVAIANHADQGTNEKGENYIECLTCDRCFYDEDDIDTTVAHLLSCDGTKDSEGDEED